MNNIHRDIIKENPFCFQFDVDKLKSIKNQIGIKKEDEDIISFFFFSHNIFNECISQFSQVFDKLKLNENDFLIFIYYTVNRYYLETLQYIEEQNSKTVHHTNSYNVEATFFKNVSFDGGIQIPISQTFEKGGDVLGILIWFFNIYKKKCLGHECIDSYSDEVLNMYSQTLWNFANKFYAFNSFCEILRYEDGRVYFNEVEKKITIRKSETNIRLSTLEKINEIRALNNSEIIYQNNLINDNIFFSSIKIENGIILPILKGKKYKSKPSNHKTLSTEVTNFNNDLKELGTEKIILIYQVIREMITTLLKSSSIKNNRIKNIPFAIEKDLLIEKIHFILGINQEQIRTVINSLVNQDIKPYFWRKFFYEFNNKLYLCYSLLSAPNYNLLLQSYSDYIEDNDENRMLHFKNYVFSQLTELRYSSLINKNLEADIINISTSNYILHIHLLFINSNPIEPSESSDYLDSINKKILSIETKTKSNVNGKEVFSMILSNCNNYTGLVLNDIPIIDISLLKNYFISGELLKLQISSVKNKNKAHFYNSFKYYENEVEFNQYLKVFFRNPLPIYEINNKINWQLIPVIPEGNNFQLYIETYEYIEDTENINYEINNLKNLLNQQYLNNMNEDNLFLSKITSFRLSNLFHFLIFNDYHKRDYRNEILDIFQKTKVYGYVYLMNYFIESLKGLNELIYFKSKEFKKVKYNKEELNPLLEKIFINNSKISISTLDLEGIFTKKEEKILISAFLDIFSVLTIKQYDSKELENFLLALGVLNFFKKKYSLNEYFYAASNNLISILNHNTLHQHAKNISEELFLLAYKEKKYYKGWEILFICYEQQNNKFKSIIYGCLYLNSLSILPEISSKEIVEVLFNILKFSRNQKLLNILDLTFSIAKEIDLKTFDLQKIHLSYYLSFASRKEDEMEKIVYDSVEFFKKNKKEIFSFREHGVAPWLNYFYNVNQFAIKGLLSSDIKVMIESIILDLEDNLNSQEKIFIKNKHFYNKDSKPNFVNNLKRAFSTYYIEDFVSEITKLELEVNVILENAILEKDYNFLFLSGLVNNDIRSIYKESIINEENINFTIVNNSNDYFDNYFEYIIDNLILKENQIFIYLFNDGNKVYYITINHKKEANIKYLNHWEASNIYLKKKEDFFFKLSKYEFLEDQEIHYNKIQKELSYTSLNIEEKFSELIITTNLNLSKTPINLIINREKFISSQYPVTNGILLEWFIKNNNQLVITEVETNCWIPIEDNDPTLILGFEYLSPVLEKFNITQILNTIPEKTFKAGINIFFAHGELDQIGFKTVSVNESKFIMDKNKLFGTGDIAILFICHSGSINMDLFSNQVQSLVHDLINSGYKAVIAPFWALDATIPSFWLNYFLESFIEGYSISEAVCIANNSLADYQEKISNNFFVPEGRLAMHLYGNPNIFIKNDYNRN